MTPRPLLLCCDLDRTVLPNGEAEETPEARLHFAELVAQPELTLVYATGRDRARVVQAAVQWFMPRANVVIADVGTTIYDLRDGGWSPCAGWSAALAEDWAGAEVGDVLRQALELCPELRAQDPSRQGAFKASFTADPRVDLTAVSARLEAGLADRGVRARCVGSFDEVARAGLLDVLPRRTGKLGALRYLQRTLGFTDADTVFAGDSGNDLEVLVSGVPSVLVANAHPSVRDRALSASREAGTLDRLYLAGGAGGGNGNYASGIVEGVRWFRPERAPTVNCHWQSLEGLPLAGK